MENNNNKQVSWSAFTAIMSIFVVVIGWIFITANTLAQRVDDYRADTQEVKVLLASMQTDLVWLKGVMAEIQKSSNM